MLVLECVFSHLKLVLGKQEGRPNNYIESTKEMRDQRESYYQLILERRREDEKELKDKEEAGKKRIHRMREMSAMEQIEIVKNELQELKRAEKIQFK